MSNSLIANMSGLYDASLFIGTIIGCIGIFIIFIGSLRGLWMFLRKSLFNDVLLSDIRIELGHYLALGLEFLIGKDIIETLAEPTWDHLGKLAVLVVLRIALTMFLAHEIKEVREELEQESAIKRLKEKMMRKKK